MTNYVTLPTDIGGDGQEYSDGVSARGLDGGGHRFWFIPLVSAIVGVANNIKATAIDIAAYAASALNAPGTSATCITSITVPSSTPSDVSFELQQTGKLFTKGQTLCFSDDADPTIQMVGPLLTFNPTTKLGTMRVLLKSGSGALSDWNVSVAAPIDSTLTGRVIALENELARLKGRSRLYNRELR